jgi:hypothetical protein
VSLVVAVLGGAVKEPIQPLALDVLAVADAGDPLLEVGSRCSSSASTAPSTSVASTCVPERKDGSKQRTYRCPAYHEANDSMRT